MLFAYNSETGHTIVSKFLGQLLGFVRMASGVKIGGHEQKPENWHFSFRARLAGHVHVDWALGTGQDVGAHTGAGGECVDVIKAGVGADEQAQLPFPHTHSLRTAPSGNPDLIAAFLV